HKQSAEPRPRQTDNQDHHGQEKKPAQQTLLLTRYTRTQCLLAQTLVALVTLAQLRGARRLCTMACTPHQASLRWFVDVVMNSQLQVRSMEFFRQRWELPFARNGSPRGAVDRVVMRRSIKPHSTNSAIRKNSEPYQRLALL